MARVTQAEKIFLGNAHEALAAATLIDLGCRVRNLNEDRRDYPHDDLEVTNPSGHVFPVQIKKSRQTNGLLLGGKVFRTPSIIEQFPFLDRDDFIVSYDHLGDPYVIPCRTLLEMITAYFARHHAQQKQPSRYNTCLLIRSTARLAGIDFAPHRLAWHLILEA